MRAAARADAVAALVILLASCGGGAPPARSPGSAQGAGATEAPALRPTRDECERAFDHILTLEGATAAVAESDRATFVQECHAEAHKRDVDCVIRAVDLNAVARCGNDAPRAP